MSDKINIEDIAQPILEKLQELEEHLTENSISEVPQIRLIAPAADSPIYFGDAELTSQDLQELEAYLQDEIEKMIHPTILH